MKIAFTFYFYYFLSPLTTPLLSSILKTYVKSIAQTFVRSPYFLFLVAKVSGARRKIKTKKRGSLRNREYRKKEKVVKRMRSKAV